MKPRGGDQVGLGPGTRDGAGRGRANLHRDLFAVNICTIRKGITPGPQVQQQRYLSPTYGRRNHTRWAIASRCRLADGSARPRSAAYSSAWVPRRATGPRGILERNVRLRVVVALVLVLVAKRVHTINLQEGHTRYRRTYF